MRTANEPAIRTKGQIISLFPDRETFYVEVIENSPGSYRQSTFKELEIVCSIISVKNIQ